MGMKFLNKKGWHTGSLRNIENVWKAEQKQEAEQRKLEELRKQIHQEREKDEFRLLQEKAGIIPRQERLEFLYESGLAVGKGSIADSDNGFKAALESSSSSLPPSSNSAPSSAATAQQPSAPGALFEEKPQSANDTWRKLHSDPLLMIRQREQEALARVKNNPVQMAIIRNSVEANKSKEKNSRSKDSKEKKHHKKKSKHHKHSSSIREEDELSDKMDYASERKQRMKHRKESSPFVEETLKNTRKEKSSKDDERLGKMDYDSKREDRKAQRRNHRDSPIEDEGRLKYNRRDVKMDYVHDRGDRKRDIGKPKYDEEDKDYYKSDNKRMREEVEEQRPDHRLPRHHVPRASSSKLSAEERAAKLKEMQMDAELHEESRWKRIKKADEIDAINSTSETGRSSGRNFLEDAKRSVYGAEKGGSSTIEESVRRRAHYSQSKSEAGQGNAFRR